MGPSDGTVAKRIPASLGPSSDEEIIFLLLMAADEPMQKFASTLLFFLPELIYSSR
jgi:hypothetical protein